MKCPYCNTEVPVGREICPNNDCYRPLKPIPVPAGGKIRFGGYDWYVLDKRDGRMLILTEKVIGRRVYHGQVCDITWENCDMRKYLNGDFYESFNATDRERVIEVTNENNNNPWYGTNGGNPTADKIFLLSLDEVAEYFGDGGQFKNRLKRDPCDWCKDEYWPWLCGDGYDINRRAVDDTGMVAWWRLRSPGASARSAAQVMGNCGDEYEHGGISMSGCDDELTPEGHFIYGANDAFVFAMTGDDHNVNGVRPAMWIRIE